MQDPSLVVVPYRYKATKLYSEIPISGIGDFTVGRLLDTATRVNSNGNIEVVNANIPRLDYYTTGGVAGCPALLVEPSAANGILNSQDTATNWGAGGSLSSGYVDVIGVSGNNLTVAVSGSNIGVSAGRLQRSSNNVALASGSTYTISFLIKKTGTHTIGGYYANITGAASGNLGAGFDISGSFSDGSLFTYTGVTSRIRRVEQWGTDVYRCSETFTMTASGTLASFNFAPLNGVTSQLNPAVGLGIAFAAPQIELGSIPTSFIPTTTGSVTRNADVISVSGAVSGLIGQSEGTLYAEVDVNNFADGNRIICLSDGTSDNRIILQQGVNSTLQAIVTTAATAVVDISTATGLTGGIYKIAIAYKQDNFSVYVNGVQTGTDVSGTVPACNQVFLGKIETTGTTNQFNNRIRAAAIYNSRLDDADLMVLTSPTYYSNVRDMIWDTFVARTSTFSELPGCLQTRHNELITL
jgi:hypothetical protein